MPSCASAGSAGERVLALVVRLLETTLIRVGNDEYARANKTFGLTTLRDRHLKIEGAQSAVHLPRQGRQAAQGHACAAAGWRRWSGDLQELPGQELFQYLDEDGQPQPIDSAEVNDYLREISGGDFTAKDFRTWAATVLAAWALQRVRELRQRGRGQAQRDPGDRAGRLAASAIRRRSAARATSTRRSSAPISTGDLLLNLKEEVEAELAEELAGLEPEEAAVLAFLQQRLVRAAEHSPVQAI